MCGPLLGMLTGAKMDDWGDQEESTDFQQLIAEAIEKLEGKSVVILSAFAAALTVWYHKK